MITVIHIAAFGLFYYWKIAVTSPLGRSGQNDHFIVVIRPQDWFSPSPERYENELQVENNSFITDLHTTGIIQIPIAYRHTDIHCLRPAVSSLGACPTPAP